MLISTPDLCDENEAKLASGELRVLDSIFVSFGQLTEFAGQIVTVKCFEDNSKVKQLAGEPGRQRIMVVDGGGSLQRALLGDMIAANAVKNGWTGFVFNGVVRDVDALNELPLGIRSLGSTPVKTEKLDRGEIDVSISIAGQNINPGEWLYADNNGTLVSKAPLL